MNSQHIKFDLETSKENLLQTILKNRENLDAKKIKEAVKEFIQNYDEYTIEKRKILEKMSIA